MKINKKEKNILIVIIILITLALGYTLVYTKQSALLQTAKDDLKYAEAEQIEINEKISTIGTLDKQIDEKYEASVELANNFFPLMRTFEADRYVQGIMKADNFYYEAMKISPVEINLMEKYVYNPEYITAALLDAANVNGSAAAVDEAPAIPAPESLPGITMEIEFVAKLSDVKNFVDNLQAAEKLSLVMNTFEFEHYDPEKEAEENAANAATPDGEDEEDNRGIRRVNVVEKDAWVRMFDPDLNEVRILGGDVLSDNSLVAVKMEFTIFMLRPLDKPTK